MGFARTRAGSWGQARFGRSVLSRSALWLFALPPVRRAAQFFDRASACARPPEVPCRSAPATASGRRMRQSRARGDRSCRRRDRCSQSLPPAAIPPGPVHDRRLLPAGQGALALSARFGRDLADDQWRVALAGLSASRTRTARSGWSRRTRRRRRLSRCRPGLTSSMSASGWPAPPKRCSCGRETAQGSLRDPGRRAADRRAGRRCPHPARADLLRPLQRQPIRAGRQAADRDG